MFLSLRPRLRNRTNRSSQSLLGPMDNPPTALNVRPCIASGKNLIQWPRKRKSCEPHRHFPVIDTSQDGYGIAKIGARWREISPLHRVHPGVPPTILFHGTDDTVTPFAGAEAFRDAMLKAGNRCELVATKVARTAT